jgi:hypothetical protein
VAKLSHDLLVQIAFEGDDQVRDFGEVDPFPGGKLGMFGVDLDILVASVEAKGKPLLPLAAKSALPDVRYQIGGQIIGQPVPALGQ